MHHVPGGPAVRRNDRVDLHGIVHVTATGERWRDSAHCWIYGAVFACGQSYRSSWKPNITKKKPTTCLWCIAGKDRE